MGAGEAENLSGLSELAPPVHRRISLAADGKAPACHFPCDTLLT